MRLRSMYALLHCLAQHEECTYDGMRKVAGIHKKDWRTASAVLFVGAPRSGALTNSSHVGVYVCDSAHMHF